MPLTRTMKFRKWGAPKFKGMFTFPVTFNCHELKCWSFAHTLLCIFFLGDLTMFLCHRASKLKMFTPASLQRCTLVTAFVSVCLSSMTSAQPPQCALEPSPGSKGIYAVGDSVSLCCGLRGSLNVTYFRGEQQAACLGPNLTCCRFELAPEDNGVDFSCIALNSSSVEPRHCSLMPLRILPSATIQRAVPEAEVGSYASFECHGVGVPSIANYSWAATHGETGQPIPRESYTLLADARVMVMQVRSSFTLS